RADGARASFAVAGATLEADGLAVAVRWTPALGVRVLLDAGAATLAVDGGPPTLDAVAPFDLPLPVLDAEGRLTFPAASWDAAARALAALGVRLGVPPLDAALRLLGWTGGGARLSLAALVGADASFPSPEAAVRAWVGDLALDCGRVEAALGPVAALLSGFTVARPFGSGSARDPYRCAVAGHRRAPGLVAWLEPGCAPRRDDLASAVGAMHSAVPPSYEALVTALAEASDALPDVRDLLVGRDGLAAGLAQLAERWRDTDGAVAMPASMPGDVQATTFDGHAYDELAALGALGIVARDVLGAAPTAVVHVGCEPWWTEGRAAGTAFDASGAGAAGTIPASGDGAWFVRLPTPAAAPRPRPDRGAVGEQAARLAQVLA
ncbi:hypothetical protein PYV61_25610, partial [Roseisolibacter sp. H3M3-2]